MKKLYAISIAFFVSQFLFSQTTLYSEDFSGQDGKGRYGNTTDVSGVNWSIDVSGASLSNGFFGIGADYFYVTGEAFAAKDTDGVAIWQSPSINIVGYTDVSFSFDAFTSGNNDTSDTFLAQYRIDGGSWTNAVTNGNLNNDFNLVVSQTGLSGSTLEIRIQIDNDSDNEITTFDNILVVGTVPCTTTPSDVSSLSASPNNETIQLDWIDSLCFDEVLVIAKSGSAVTATPTGDGSAYAANTVFGSGTEITTDEFIVYKGTGNTVTTTGLTNGTTYHFEVFTRKGTNWSAGVVVNAVPNLNYCTVVGDLTYATAITLVDFGSINNVTGQDPDDGYSDFTNLSTTVTKGTTEDLTVNLDTDGNYLVYSYAWIDWNQDGDFEDAGEAYDLGFAQNTPNGPTSLSALSISIPTYAALGNTRLRIVCQYNPPPPAPVETLGPCLDSTDGEFEDYTINVTGSITYAYNGSWTPADPNGVANSTDTINIDSGDATISSNTSCNTATVSAGASLTVNSGVTFSAIDLTLESSNTSYSSLILNGSISGTINYERHVNVQSGGNDLISAPLTGQTFGDFAAANSNIFSNPSNTSQKLFGPWSKVTNEYVIYDTDIPADANTILDPAIGYRAASSDNGTFVFSGTANTGVITKDLLHQGPHETEWNLVGNPYPAYLNVQDFLNHDLGGGVTNMQLFDIGTAAIYGYDGDVTDGWVIYNLATTTASTVIAPGQGFFVSADPTKVAAYDLEFTPAMQSTGSSDDFIPGRTSSLTYVKLLMSNSVNSSKTEFYFNANASQGFDQGYDAMVWGEDTADFSIYSRLVEDNSGEAIALQALNTLDLSADTLIPLGVNANQGEQITFSISESTLPNHIKVYLEDTATNSSVLLNSNDYILTPSTVLSGSGRFFLRFTEDELSTSEHTFESIEVFTTKSPRALFIKGELNPNTKVYLYDVQGRLIMNTSLDHTTDNNQIDLNGVGTGLYIVTLDDGIKQHSVKTMID